MSSEHFETVIIGGGQAGLSVGYHLAKHDRPFVIVDANERIGDTWRNRWDSLRLFTPAWLDGLTGMPFPAPRHSFPTAHEMADYLESFAAHFDLPIRSGVAVDRLCRKDGRFVVSAGHARLDADNVVVAMSRYQQPRVPAFAADLHPEVVQMHSVDYRNPAQLREGGVLIVGAGNSGAEIALDVAPTHPTCLAGPDTGQLPFRIDGAAARVFLIRLLLRGVFHRVLTVNSRAGRRGYQQTTTHGQPRVRVRSTQITAAGIERLPKVAGMRDGLPVLEDGRVIDVANVIWCTGFDPGLSWIELPVLGNRGEPVHERGIASAEPGLTFVGRHFLYTASSGMIHGLWRDAEYIAAHISSRASTAARVP